MHMVGLLLFTLNPKPEEDKPKEQDRIFKYDYFVSNKKFVLQLVDILLSLRIFFPVFLQSLIPLNLSICIITNYSPDLFLVLKVPLQNRRSKSSTVLSTKHHPIMDVGRCEVATCILVQHQSEKFFY